MLVTALNLGNISKHSVAEGARRHFEMPVWKLGCCVSSQGGRRLLVLEGCHSLALFGFLRCIKQRRQQTTRWFVLKCSCGGDDFSFKPYHSSTHQSTCLQTPWSPNPLVSLHPLPFDSLLLAVRSSRP